MFGCVSDVAVVAVCPIIFLARLPDKTMSRLSSCRRGAARSRVARRRRRFSVHVVIAVPIGVALFHLLPHQVLDAVVAGMFLVGAALALREAASADEEIVEREVASHRRIAVTAFLVIFLAEHLTQSPRAWPSPHHDPLSVGVGAVLALWAVAGWPWSAGRACSG